MPGNFVTHFHANATANKRSRGPNEMFKALQQAKLGLQRHKVNTCVDGSITRHFTSNYGLPYKFIVAQDSTPFAEAPEVVLDGLRHLTWAIEKAVGAGLVQKPNEVLVLGYLEDQKIGVSHVFHRSHSVDL